MFCFLEEMEGRLIKFTYCDGTSRYEFSSERYSATITNRYMDVHTYQQDPRWYGLAAELASEASGDFGVRSLTKIECINNNDKERIRYELLSLNIQDIRVNDEVSIEYVPWVNNILIHNFI